MVLTLQQIAIACGAPPARAASHVDALNEALAAFDITTPARAGMFLVNIGHETLGLLYLRELWGPTSAQVRYERDFSAPWPRSVAESRLPPFVRNRLAYSLGNTERGDGRKFAGGGHLHTTGRYNYAIVRDRLRARFPDLDVPDFEADPAQLQVPRWAALAAGDYVAMKGCNGMADAGDFDGYCDLVNRGRKTEDEGDSNGWEDRLARWTKLQRGGALA